MGVAGAVLAASLLGAWIVQRGGRRRQETAVAAAFESRLQQLEGELRQAIDASATRASMQIGSRVAQLQDALTAHVTQITGVQAEQLGAYGRAMQQQLGELTGSSRCGQRSRKSSRPRWKRAWANRFGWSPSDLNKCTRGWAKCRRWPPE